MDSKMKMNFFNAKAEGLLKDEIDFVKKFIELGDSPDDARKNASDYASLRQIATNSILAPKEQKRLDEYNKRLGLNQK